MKHKHRKRLRKRYKRLAAAVAGAVLMSSAAMLPGVPVAKAYASPTTSALANNNAAAVHSIVSASRVPENIQINTEAPVVKPPIVKNKIVKQAQPAKAAKDLDKTANIAKTDKPVEQKQDVNKNQELKQNKDVTKETQPKETKEAQPKEIKEAQPAEEKAAETAAAPAPAPEKEKKQVVASAGKPPENFERVLDIKATAYAPGAQSNEQWGDKTYMGTRVRPGVIAVDPKVIPLGSKVYIEYPDGHGEYAVAEDVGGAIKGNRIDIAMRNNAVAEDFGIQNVKVYVVNSPEKS